MESGDRRYQLAERVAVLVGRGRNPVNVKPYREGDPSTYQANPSMPASATITAADAEEEEEVSSPQAAAAPPAAPSTAADTSADDLNTAGGGGEDAVDTTRKYLDGPPTKAFSGPLSSPLGPLLDTHREDPTLQFTCYGLTFKAIIDHIVTDPATMAVVQTLPAPKESELAAEIGIPSTQFPSDHIPLVVDLKYV